MSIVQIEKLAFGGAGFGRLDGKACFVPYTAPGDVAEITIAKNKSSYIEGVLNKLITPSVLRCKPVCPVFGNCGGCNWQHISYEEQCTQKEMIFADTLWRIARVGQECIKPLARASEPFTYRQRIQLKVNVCDGMIVLGFYRPGSHFVVDLPGKCAITAAPINSAISETRDILQAFPEAAQIPQVDLSADSDGTVTALFHYSGRNKESLIRHLAQYKQCLKQIAGVSVQTGRKYSINFVFGPEMLRYTVPSPDGNDLNMSYGPDSFSQVNFSQNRALIDAVLTHCSNVATDRVLDLFCGNGNFSLPVARLAGSVTGMESFAKSISLAKYNALQNSINNAEFTCEDSAAGVARLARAAEHYDLVLLDPPRSGAESVARILHRLKPQHLIYVSCDPPTLARDLSTLQKSGFKVVTVQPVDMFPQTYHLESVTLLESIQG